MITSSQLMLSLGEVKRTTVCLSSSRNNINNTCYYGRDMSCEYKPTPILSHDNLIDIHSSSKKDHSYDSQSERKLITYHLSTGTHSTNKSILIIRGPTGKQDTKNTDRTYSQYEEYTNIIIDYLHTTTPGKTRKHCY